MKLGSDINLSLASRPTNFNSPAAYTDPQILREEDLEQLPDDYGRDEDEEDEAYGDEQEGAQ